MKRESGFSLAMASQPFQLYSFEGLTLFCLMFSLRQSSAPIGPALGNPAFRYIIVSGLRYIVSGFSNIAKMQWC